MHTPPAFAVDDALPLLRSAVSGDLVTSTDDGLLATLLPWTWSEERRSLQGHVARANPQWRTPARGDALVLLRAHEAYVSPSWYAAKREHGRVVPTWDYVQVQVHGELVVHDDPAWLADVVDRLTARHEAGRAEPWAVEDAPAAWVAGQLRGVVGVEVRATRVEAKAKLSQNRSAADVDGVVAGLRADGLDAVADAVEAARR